MYCNNYVTQSSQRNQHLSFRQCSHRLGFECTTAAQRTESGQQDNSGQGNYQARIFKGLREGFDFETFWAFNPQRLILSCSKRPNCMLYVYVVVVVPKVFTFCFNRSDDCSLVGLIFHYWNATSPSATKMLCSFILFLFWSQACTAHR